MPKVGLTIMQALATPLLLAVLALCAPLLAHADSTHITFVVVKNEGIYKKIIDSAQQSLKLSGHEIDATIVEVSEVEVNEVEVNKVEVNEADVNKAKKAGHTSAISNADSQIVSIGTKAAAFSYQQFPNRPVTNALITHSSFAQLAQDNFGSSEQALAKQITPLFIDQPISRFIALGLELVPNAKTIGVLVGPSNKSQIPTIKAKAASNGLRINIAQLEPNSNPIKVIEPVMRGSDFFVVLPDRKHINQLAAKWTLPLSYRYRKPLIAYSQKYVDAGALASVFTSLEDVADSIALQLQQKTDSDQSTPFSVSLNRAVGRSLRIQLRKADEYQQRLQNREAAEQ